MRTIIRHALAGLMIMGLAGVATAQKKEFGWHLAAGSRQEDLYGYDPALDSDAARRSLR